MVIPFHRQTTDYTCGPASLQMVFEYFGKYISQKKLEDLLKTSKDAGTNHEALIGAATDNGFYCYVNNESTVHEIKHFLLMHLPVIIHYIEPSSQEGQYAVVSGLRSGKLVLNDPWNGKGFHLSERNFLKRWHDSKNVHKNWIMTVSKEDFNIGKQFLPKE